MSMPGAASPAIPPAPELSPQRGSDYAQLSRQVRQAGLMDRRPWFYGGRIAATAALLVGGWVAFVLVGES